MQSTLLSLLAGVLIAVGLPAHADEPFGFRANGQGRFPNATPVLEWSPTNNVIWRTELPKFSNSSPVLTSNRLFTCAEPSLLICVNLADGKILWQKSNDYADVLTNPEQQNKLQSADAAVNAVNQRLAAKLDERDETAWLMYKHRDPSLKTKVDALQAEVDEIHKELLKANGLVLPVTRPENGYTSATPVTDGKHVWAVFGSGVVVCYDVNGKRIWAAKIDTPCDHMGWGSCSSPVLAGKILLVQYNTIFGLEAETGKVLWKGKDVYADPKEHKVEVGTAALEKIGDQYTAYTCKGTAINVSNGAEVASDLKKLGNSPVLQDGVLYCIEAKSEAFRLSRNPADKPAKLWDGEALEPGAYYASPLVQDGLIYVLTGSGKLFVLDAKTGQKVYEKKILGGTCYCSPTLAGKYILIGSDNGKMVVIEPGREYKEVAQNDLEPFRSTPVFAGSRMYVRTLKSLYCIGK